MNLRLLLPLVPAELRPVVTSFLDRFDLVESRVSSIEGRVVATGALIETLRTMAHSLDGANLRIAELERAIARVPLVH